MPQERQAVLSRVNFSSPYVALPTTSRSTRTWRYLRDCMAWRIVESACARWPSCSK